MGGASILNWEELDSSMSLAFWFPLKLSGEVMSFLKNTESLWEVKMGLEF